MHSVYSISPADLTLLDWGNAAGAAALTLTPGSRCVPGASRAAQAPVAVPSGKAAAAARTASHGVMPGPTQ
jgi:hypothetical protein